MTTTEGNISTTDIDSYSLSGNGGAIALETINGNILLQGSSINTFSSSTGGRVSFTGNVSLNQPLLTITTSSGNIIFNNDVNGTISGNNSLTLNPDAGKVQFLGKVGSLTPLNNLTINGIGMTEINGNVTTTNAQTYNNAVIANGDVILTGQEINFDKTVAGNGNLTLQPFTVDQNINIGGVADVSTTLNLSAVDIKALQDGFNSIIIGRQDGRGIISFTGITTFLDPVILRSPLGQTNANNAIIAPEINFNSPINIGADITTIAPQVYNYPVLFTNNSTITSNQGVLFNKTVNGNVNLNINSGSANVIFTEAVGNLQPLTSLNINSSGKTSLSNVTAATISTDAEGTTELNGNLTATAGNIQLNDPITLNNSTILTAKTSITTNTINGNYDLTLNAGSNITFNKDLGNTRDFLGNIIINQAVNVTGKNINAASINQFATGSINLGNMITNIGGVGLNSSNNITTGNITTSGQQISLTGTNISTGNINSSSPNVGGNIRILATNQIFTGNIDSSAKFGNGGNVTIDPITTIIDSINAQGGISGVGGNVEIRSHDTLRTTGTFIDRNGVLASISTAGGLGGGSIVIYHPGVLSFTVGNAGSHGTAGAITTGVSNSILPQILFSSTYTQNNISIISTDLRPDVQIFTPPKLDIKDPSVILNNNAPKLDVKDTSVILNNNVDNILSDSNTNRQIVSNQLIAGNIKGAVSSIEQVLSGEYQGYYGEELQLDSQPQTVETIQAALRSILKQTGKRSAIFYMISQPKSLDLVIITPDGKPIHHNVKIDRQKLIADIRLFRNNVTDVKINGYKESGKTLYNSLVAPIEAALVTEKIDTLLLSVDNNLRSLPFSALYDGKNFLVEKYNIGLIPSVTLMDTGYKSLKNSQILLMGASKFTSPNQNPLPGVMVELPTVGREFGENRYFINQEFTIENLRKQRQQRPTQIVHLATHGEFNPGDSSQSYIQFWGEEKLQINQIRTLGLRNPPVELLVLSACRTALGNEQVELGFAGLAVQAGVKSALASLWYVSDEGTLGLMNEFYQKLKTAPIKSEALRQAQLAMIQGKVSIKNGELIGTRRGISLPPELLNIKNRNLSHPYYWSAFTMIGSPW
ncbi:MAG: CHAT domain-containing protein [Cuspidothrix sp.]